MQELKVKVVDDTHVDDTHVVTEVCNVTHLLYQRMFSSELRFEKTSAFISFSLPSFQR